MRTTVQETLNPQRSHRCVWCSRPVPTHPTSHAVTWTESECSFYQERFLHASCAGNPHGAYILSHSILTIIPGGGCHSCPIVRVTRDQPDGLVLARGPLQSQQPWRPPSPAPPTLMSTGPPARPAREPRCFQSTFTEGQS